MVEVTQADREAAADVLDEVCSLIEHNGIGQAADLIRDGEYDEHPCVQRIAAHRIAERERCARVVEKFTQDIKNWHGGQAAERIWTAIRITQ